MEFIFSHVTPLCMLLFEETLHKVCLLTDPLGKYEYLQFILPWFFLTFGLLVFSHEA